MNRLPNIDVDAVVRAVLAELAKRGGGPKPGADAFAGRLLGVAQAEAIGREAREVTVRPGTVVTPMARDLLKQRGVVVRVATAEQMPIGRSAGDWGFGVEPGAGGKAEAIRRPLLEAWREVDPAEVPRWVVAEAGRGALLLTGEASVAAWKANRVDGVRAATAADVDGTSRAIRHLGVNCLVVEPLSLSIPTLRAIAEAFRRGGPPAPPEGLR